MKFFDSEDLQVQLRGQEKEGAANLLIMAVTFLWPVISFLPSPNSMFICILLVIKNFLLHHPIFPVSSDAARGVCGQVWTY